ncbi:MAG: ribonuclease R [Firmicutes bacterium]|nr:ribonuclease R [Bacillota bacterium]
MKNVIMRIMTAPDYQPMTEKELLEAAGIDPDRAGQFLAELDFLEQEGAVCQTKKKKYLLPEAIGLTAATISRNKRNFGFAIPLKEDRRGDIFIPKEELMGAMNGDTVLVQVTEDRVENGAGSREGRVVKILSRGAYRFAGTFEGSRKFGFVTDTGAGEDFFIARSDMNGARNGDRVVIRVREWPSRGRRAEGIVTEVLGRATDPEALLRSLVYQHGLRTEFPDKALEEAEAIDPQIPEEEWKRRTDLQGKTIVTIDGADAKDLDDAVSVEKLPNGNFLLGVHIADVSHYVQQDSPLDREAFRRGTSVYYIDRVIPMLPEKLSNGVCSLNPQVPRLTLTCEMEIDRTGEVVGHSIYESVIRSAEKLVYTDISDILEKEDEALKERYRTILPDLRLMAELAEILRKRRRNRGSIDFDLDETYIDVDEDGKVKSIGIAERRTANRIIEEFMLKANETVSEHFFWLDIPFVFRVHEPPEAEKIEALKAFLWSLGFTLKGSSDNIHPGALNEIVEKVKGKPEENVVNTVVLRSMSKAKYSEQALGHFGLGMRYYSHFTSPIRRYPDLLIHRIIKEYLRGGWNDEREAFYQEFVPEAALQSSNRERAAEKMEKDADKLKMAEYMSAHIGEEYEGIISGILASGFFVELPNTVEGFVRVSSLEDDYYVYDRSFYRFAGERTGKTYALGQQVKVVVASADIEKREIDFRI